MLLLAALVALGWAAEMTSPKALNTARLLLNGDSLDLLSNPLGNLSLQDAEVKEWLGVKINVKSPNWKRFTEIVKDLEAGKQLQSGDFGGNLKSIDKLTMLTVMAHCQLIEWTSVIPCLKELTLDDISISTDDLTVVEVKELDLLWLGRERFPSMMPLPWLKSVAPKGNLTHPLILRLLPLIARTSKRFDTSYGTRLLKVIGSLCMMAAGRVLREANVLKLIETMPVGQYWDHLICDTNQMVRIGKLVPIDGYVIRLMPHLLNASPRFYSRMSHDWQGPQQARWQDFQGLVVAQVRSLITEQSTPPMDKAMNAESTVPPFEDVSGMPVSLKGAIRLAWWMEMVMRDTDLAYYLQANLNIMMHSIARLRELKSRKEADGLAEPSLPWLIVFKHTIPDILETCHQRHLQLASKKMGQLHHDTRSRLVHMAELERGILEHDYDTKQVDEYFGPSPPFSLHPCYNPLPSTSSSIKEGKRKKALGRKKEKSPSPPEQLKSDGIRRSVSGEQLKDNVGALRRRKLSDQSEGGQPGRAKLSQSTPKHSSPNLLRKPHARSFSNMGYFSVPVPRHAKGEEKKNLVDESNSN